MTQPNDVLEAMESKYLTVTDDQGGRYVGRLVEGQARRVLRAALFKAEEVGTEGPFRDEQGMLAAMLSAAELTWEYTGPHGARLAAAYETEEKESD